MAYTEFYVQSGGSDLNAGSTTANGAVYTSVSAAWDGTSVFTPVDGSTPASTVSVGDYASVYANGSSSTSYVAKVTAVAAGVNGAITLSTTIKYGTAPSVGAVNRSIKTGGAHAGELPWVNFGATTIPQSTRVNWKQATYTVAASRTLALAATAVLSLWFRGYNTTIGDCDSDASLQIPVLSGAGATASFTASGASQLWSSIEFTTARSGTSWGITGNGQKYYNCIFLNTSTNAGANAVQTVASGLIFTYCLFGIVNGPTGGTVIVSTAEPTFIGCIISGGTTGPNLECSTFNVNLINCIFSGCVNSILASTAVIRSYQSTFYNSSGDAIKWSGSPGSGSLIQACLFSNIGGYGINNNSGTNTGNVVRITNDYYSVTSGAENGFGDYANWYGQTESSQVLTTPGTNYTPVSGSNAVNNGVGHLVPNTAGNSYLDIGAVQRQSTGSGFSGGVFGS